ncbi:histone H2A deubiquitinase MYSM1-like [Coccinella septempunctata]|uniref:histone H2A deubiquitinase MYSM1-like n=1 Tax=Coccinella septempunctata TaxID=41139 RepID=UPI001D071EF8|nr:histone H2A deubiquitinase MYSM1-like [Coccinella septempunctata]
MDEDEEINIVGDPDFLKSEYTVHPQWLLDRPSTNPDCWYNNSPNRVREDSDHDPIPIGHITTENSITDESGWTEKEKTLLERGIEIFGKSPLRLSQFIGTKTPSEIKYYFKSFYMELHPTHSAKNREPRDDFVPIHNMLMDPQIPCTSKQIVVNDVEKRKRKRKRKMSKSKELNAIKIPKQKHHFNKFNIIPNKGHGKTGPANPVQTTSSSSDNVPVTPKLLQGEVVYMTKHSDSDVEIDIEDEDDCDNEKTLLQSEETPSVSTQLLNEPSSCVESSENEGNSSDNEQQVLNQLSSLDIPRCEVKLETDSVSDLERYVFSEFLSQTTNEKSTENYLKLRNHIIFIWNYKKPNYLTKGDIQKGYKPSVRGTLCKIHNFLEQIGVINYGCGRVRYIRPMHKIFKNPKNDNKLKTSSQPKRFKKKFLYNGEGGCTMSHGAHGEIIDATVINQDPVHSRSKTVKKHPTYLIYCKPTPLEYKYKLKLHLSTLLLMDFHAHSSLSEVMGLVGGLWNPDTKFLSIMHYEPCKNLASSTTHCDMCPVSQSVAAERINDIKMILLGWFHSHPTFAPEPSQQDLDTQRQLQKWIGDEKPCVGVILSPFNRPTALTPSEYRCMIVDKFEEDERFLPYKFKVEIVSEHFDLDSFIANIVSLRNFILSNSECQDPKLKVNFQEPYMHDKSITFLEKYISSARMTLERYLSEQLCQKIVKSIASVFSDERA